MQGSKLTATIKPPTSSIQTIPKERTTAQTMENKVVITVHEEAPRRPSTGCPKTNRHKLRAPARGYDRRGMLLAYSRQLRQFNAQQQQEQAERRVMPPEWKKWKSTYKDQLHYKRRKGVRGKIRAWMRRTFRKKQQGCNRIIVSGDEDEIMEMSSCSCSNHCQLRRVLNRIVCAWRRRGGLMGCYEKLNC